MVKHLVLLKLPKTCRESSIINVMNKFRDLSLELKFKNFVCGYNNSNEDLNKGFNYAFSMEFDSINERDNYVNNTSHISIAKQYLLPLINNDIESILVFDL
ncbi:Dabb family protein [Francisella sp. SYW-9]|uniref:Dabb family protein n=1 Tax=Francisella sp. SYW-9 TaxID=2610888 RepID=UPI00123DBB0F|nr:Dabb family protein [Francisella sp. SYW-9]